MKLIIVFAVTLSLLSCTTVEIKSLPDLCSDQRLPSSEKIKCMSQFKANHVSVFIEKAKHKDSGLTQTTFVATDGTILKQGPQVPALDRKQIVSFYANTNSDGTPNRGGVMVQGTPTEIMFDQSGKPAYIHFAKQKVRLLEYTPAFIPNSTQPIKDQGFHRHNDGFSSPLGLLKGWTISIAEYSIQELKSLFEKYTVDGVTTLEFESGVIVKGVIVKFTENKSGNFGSPTVITFKNCDVKLGDRYLYRHEQGPHYDMILSTMITETNANIDTPEYNPNHN